MIVQIEPWIDDAELDELKKVIASTYIVEATMTKEFENRTQEMTGSKHVIAYTNGTAALYACLKAMDIGPGDEVIVPAMTFIATANAVIMAGAEPIFCDVTSDTFCIDLGIAQKLVTPKTKAIIPVHLYGQAADMDVVLSFAKKNNLKVLEDAAQGVGVKFNGKHVGTLGDMGILSYYSNKTITCGEGGIILTQNDELAKRSYRLKNHGRDKKGIFIHEHIGFNFSFTEMQAAVGVAQMKKLPRIIEKKNKIAARYNHELKGIKGFDSCYIDPRCSPVYWFTSFLADDAGKLGTYLFERGIQSRRFFYPLHLQPCYQNLLKARLPCPVTEDIYNRGISLPSAYHLTDDDQGKVIAAIREYYS